MFLNLAKHSSSFDWPQFRVPAQTLLRRKGTLCGCVKFVPCCLQITCQLPVGTSLLIRFNKKGKNIKRGVSDVFSSQFYPDQTSSYTRKAEWMATLFNATRPTFPTSSSSSILPAPAATPAPRPRIVTQPKHCFRLCSKKVGQQPLPAPLFLSSYSVPRQQESRSGHLSPCIKLHRLKAGLSGMFHFQVDIDALAGSSGVACVWSREDVLCNPHRWPL